jgi:hypothetical protein
MLNEIVKVVLCEGKIAEATLNLEKQLLGGVVCLLFCVFFHSVNSFLETSF